MNAEKAFGSKWFDLCAEAGIAPEGWQAEVASRRDDRQRTRIVWRLTRGDARLAVKEVRAPRDPDAFLADITAQMEAASRFDGFPELLAVDAEAQICVMRWAEGETLFDALSRPDADHAALLALAGGWIAGLHGAGIDARRNFQPKYSVRHLRRLAHEMETGARPAPPRARDWQQAAARLADMAADFEGRETVSTLGHGDLNLRNLMICGTQVTGLDPRPVTPVPVGHDIARFAVHYGALLAPPDATGRILPGVDLSGLFAGYDVVGVDEPSIGFLCRMRVLIDWQTLPPEPRQTGPERRRFAGLLRLAHAAFETPK
ncbi:Phosphotransferase enzyme family protein [Roseivivax sp. THAF40]|uniref:phosphotransferase n=1 Tax=unclassified Roseivivax TaxID=2639302 RepID=UPI0012696AE9|nr:MULTISPECIES: phosphotransferase [unclassified Roseivivax]QFS84656.1 Phosphotransferase enzyme family protein [Roseivivax sp. THAF197b]QFT48483.1 Phosphotransferase enzyme family protein [Roseivivax sp. THAF40]